MEGGGGGCRGDGSRHAPLPTIPLPAVAKGGRRRGGGASARQADPRALPVTLVGWRRGE